MGENRRIRILEFIKFNLNIKNKKIRILGTIKKII